MLKSAKFGGGFYMKVALLERRSILFLFIVCIFTAISVLATAQQKEFTPVEGQPGKDVMWLPTSPALVEKMLDIAKLTPQDFLIDLGSGDGRLVIAAAKRGARALGIEYDPDLVELSKRKAEKEGVSDRAQFIRADIFESDFSQATVITMFLLPELNLRLRPQILKLKPGTRIVSNTFDMGDWIADEAVTLRDGWDCSYYCTALLWIVPANIEGRWKFLDGELIINQRFQKISGIFKSGSKNIVISNGYIRGEEINFSLGKVDYKGLISKNSMEGSFKAGRKTGQWRAIKISN